MPETTCRLQGVDTYTYLIDVLRHIVLPPASRAEGLTPLCWKALFAAAPLR